jgi:excinuclease ABC subunit A
MLIQLEESGKSKSADIAYSRQLMCEDTGISYKEPSPNSFSFNSPYGACPTCKGLGKGIYSRHESNHSR